MDANGDQCSSSAQNKAPTTCRNGHKTDKEDPVAEKDALKTSKDNPNANDKSAAADKVATSSNKDTPISNNDVPNTNKDTPAEGKEDDVLECAICLNPCMQPVQLPCSHVFCFLCAKVSNFDSTLLL